MTKYNKYKDKRPNPCKKGCGNLTSSKQGICRNCQMKGAPLSRRKTLRKRHAN